MKSRHRYRQFLRVFIILISLSLARDIPAQESISPLKLKDLLLLLEKKVEDDVIIHHIQKYKVDFVLDQPGVVAQLINAGAKPPMLTAIQENPFRPLHFTFPNNGDVVSHFIRVEGWSKKIPNKHLWLFVHQKGGSDWLPQDGEVVLKENGEWKHDVNVGLVQNTGLDFEIKAVWVDSKSHEELMKYVQCKTVNKQPDSCPGIRLPEGENDQIAVRRLNQ